MYNVMQTTSPGILHDYTLADNHAASSVADLRGFPVVQGWTCTQVFEGHSHYVMQVVFNPKDTNTFASASLDRTIKVMSMSHLHLKLSTACVVTASQSVSQSVLVPLGRLPCPVFPYLVPDSNFGQVIC